MFLATPLLRSCANESAAATPLARTDVVLTAGGTTATLRWSNPPGSGAVSYTTVALIDVTTDQWAVQGSAARCYDGCTSYTFRGLAEGHTYWGVVEPVGPAGPGPRTGSGSTITIERSPCTAAGSEACITVDATSPAGPVTHAAAGLLHSPDAPAQWIAGMAPRWWRLSDGTATNPDYRTMRRARAMGSKTISVLSDGWWMATRGLFLGYAEPPWFNNWADWESYVQAKVRRSMADGMSPDYWEVWNEPGGKIPPILPLFNASFTPDMQLQLYAHTWRAVKAADPNGKLAWTATSIFHGHASEDGTVVAVDQLLPFIRDNGIGLDLLTWHENAAFGWEDADSFPRYMIERHVSTARHLLSTFGFGATPIAIDEYTTPTNHAIPAWTLDYMVGIENAGVAGANRACWQTRDPNGSNATIDGCGNEMMDNLLSPPSATSGPEPRSVYWVYDSYRQMSGQRVAVTSTTAWVSGLATSDGASIRILIGRHVGCVPAANPACAAGSPAPGPATETVTVDLPGGTGWHLASAKSMPPVWGPVASLPTKQVAVSTSGTQLKVTIPAFADGEVVSLVLAR